MWIDRPAPPWALPSYYNQTRLPRDSVELVEMEKDYRSWRVARLAAEFRARGVSPKTAMAWAEAETP